MNSGARISPTIQQRGSRFDWMRVTPASAFHSPENPLGAPQRPKREGYR